MFGGGILLEAMDAADFVFKGYLERLISLQLHRGGTEHNVIFADLHDKVDDGLYLKPGVLERPANKSMAAVGHGA